MITELKIAELQEWAIRLQHEAPPFLDLGRSRDGLDCWGVPCLAFSELLGLVLPGYEEAYESTRDKERLARLFTEGHLEWVEVPEESAQPFDLVNLRLRGRPIHVGLVLSGRRFVHIMERSDVLIESWNDRTWKDRKIGFFRHPTLS